MTNRDITELAAILVNEHGNAAHRIAEARRAQFRPDSDGYRLWSNIATEAARLLATLEKRRAKQPCH